MPKPNELGEGSWSTGLSEGQFLRESVATKAW